ncbi:uncharacterized protein LOC142766947 isoform X2 [Rhipicephalus microplus]|uniref:uncharacterized protein LOC142766947 isoform X2 n=1 Tax=Rhipicephalus microplus TaxID=6941 RepID=UPI003F6B2F8F
MTWLLVFSILTTQVYHAVIYKYPWSKAVKPKVKTTTKATPGPVDEKFSATVKLIENLDKMELISVTLETYMSFDCVCVKSVLQAKFINGADRTIECYRDATIIAAPPTTAFTIGRKTLIKVTDESYFEVVNDGGTKIVLKDPDHPHIDYYEDHPPFRLAAEYEVLLVKETCLVAAFGPVKDGKRHCMVWGKLPDNDITKNECNDIPSLCENMYDVWETPKSDPCLVYDKQEELRRKKYLEEEIKQINGDDK